MHPIGPGLPEGYGSIVDAIGGEAAEARRAAALCPQLRHGLTDRGTTAIDAPAFHSDSIANRLSSHPGETGPRVRMSIDFIESVSACGSRGPPFKPGQRYHIFQRSTAILKFRSASWVPPGYHAEDLSLSRRPKFNTVSR